MDFFSNQAGKSVIIPDSGMPLALSVQNWPGAKAAKACLAGISAGASVNIQFMHTLRNVVYFDIFGDRVSEIRLSILAFAGDCSEDKSTGLDNVWKYYLNNRASVLGSPLSLVVGANVKFSGFLTGLQMNLADTMSGITQFGLQFQFVPPESFK